MLLFATTCVQLLPATLHHRPIQIGGESFGWFLDLGRTSHGFLVGLIRRIGSLSRLTLSRPTPMGFEGVAACCEIVTAADLQSLDSKAWWSIEQSPTNILMRAEEGWDEIYF
jgi:hypothetical protein